MSTPKKFNPYVNNPALFFVIAARARERLLAVPDAHAIMRQARRSIKQQLAFHIVRRGGRA
jgi:hypothetical protein